MEIKPMIYLVKPGEEMNMPAAFKEKLSQLSKEAPLSLPEGLLDAQKQVESNRSQPLGLPTDDKASQLLTRPSEAYSQLKTLFDNLTQKYSPESLFDILSKVFGEVKLPEGTALTPLKVELPPLEGLPEGKPLYLKHRE